MFTREVNKSHKFSAKLVCIQEKIIPIFLAPLSPLLNPIQQFWEHLKAELQWQNCSTLNQLYDQSLSFKLCCSSQKIIEQITPELIIWLTGWDFIISAILSSSLHKKSYPLTTY
ncbi:hypothetical protein DP113_24895 [Brasilonema octagenarum UFV-E1]|uniref:Tc1-like transposase DDE domain-containing protein n=2 Tax=Brasilonema TaxID=383614 RepID=A0A856MKS4_9CYAN|nr:hypothetical protein [Brasilonema octagenarum UFV-OR1]QDL10724.1 hypothetical protein DP114_24995 [Brasilonema sennae CENA114]QDL17068.1 hypothetical protein DP113_24895 [Brasilonema octagenarum UFV-E1]